MRIWKTIIKDIQITSIKKVTNRIFSDLIVDLDSTDMLFIPINRNSIDFVVTTDLREWLKIVEFLIFLVFNTNQDMSWDEGISEDLCLEVLHEQRGRESEREREIRGGRYLFIS